jgi:hypothetical protein
MRGRNLLVAVAIVALVSSMFLAPVISVFHPIACGPLESCPWSGFYRHESLTFYLFGIGLACDSYGQLY